MCHQADTDYLTSNFLMPRTEALAWAGFARKHGVPLEIAPGWYHEGFSLKAAMPWIEALGLYDETAAIYFTKAGWTPEQADVLLRAYMARPEVAAARIIDVSGWLRTLKPWMDSGIPPSWVCRYVAAGVSLDETLGFEKRRAAGQDIESALNLLTAFQVDPDP